ncbi:response regulator transcription factor [Neorhodopirellula pilleata]|uniref:Transcriptional activator protein CopR n=1 Tax=Neorhodopirellula pilleata TaxID=2714738 RepID=A0A5C6A740_9BACT|nr:response regulator transcription factor [Neorhodopirellula pilleata]TWT95724.1 Transcriptional activator protein CopR [Neorhodopirellula pilleata]
MRVLVVEDDPDLRSGLVSALREEGYAVDQASDGSDGFAQARAWDYDAIVLDRMLPKLSGLDLLRQLRQSSAVPVLLLTACDTVEDRVTGLDGGADDYLVKPFDLSELFARLRAIIRRRHEVTSTSVWFGNVEINFASRTVEKDGCEIELTAREYALVEIFAMRRGQLVTRTYLYDHLFDDCHDSMSNLVDVYVSRVRAKLGRDFVRTRRGEGYLVSN